MKIAKISKYALYIGLTLLIVYCYVRSCTNFWGFGEPEINKIEQQTDGSYMMSDTTRSCNPNGQNFYTTHIRDSTENVDYKSICVHCGSRWSYHKTSLEWTEVSMSYNN